ncbi:L-rhamnose-binding lectin SML-like [Aulostomus maculatus]
MVNYRLSTTLLLTVTCSLVKAVLSTERAITCQGNNGHRLNCDRGVIVVQSSLYGRASREICGLGRPSSELVNTQCSLPGTLELVKNRCDGKQTCELSASVVSTSDPCRGIFKYLETNYTCFPAFHTVACERAEMTLKCDVGQVIFVYGADYGRHDRTTCVFRRPENQIVNIECARPTTLVAERCNGRNSCSISASNAVFGDPCVGTYKYLQVGYICEFPSST